MAKIGERMYSYPHVKKTFSHLYVINTESWKIKNTVHLFFFYDVTVDLTSVPLTIMGKLKHIYHYLIQTQI